MNRVAVHYWNLAECIFYGALVGAGCSAFIIVLWELS